MEDNINEEILPDGVEQEETQSESRIMEYFEYIPGDKKNNHSDVLIMLHELTKIDNELTEIMDEKGDLPEKISDLEEKIALNAEKITEKTAEKESLESEAQKLEKENSGLDEKISKYDEQKYSVKNNKEYDEIMKSIDNFLELYVKNEARVKEIKVMLEKIGTASDEIKKNDEEMQSELKESRDSLNELNKQYEDDESELEEKKEKIISKLSEDVKSLYERINSSFKGEATAIVRNGNCSGCYNSVPPQRVIEIKIAAEIYICQSCGRILIDEKLVTA